MTTPIILKSMANANVEDFVIRVRDHYVAQFRAFVARERAACIIGDSEVKFKLTDDTTAFRRIVVVDFVRNDGTPEDVLFEPETILTLDRVEGCIAATKFKIDSLRWDAVVIHHDAPHIDAEIDSWFLKWFDPDEDRLDHAAELSECIHAVYVEPNELQVDFGTAPVEAFWELLDSLVQGSATFLNVHSSET